MMKIALLGYGKMNRSIESLANAAGHEIPLVVRSKDDASEFVERLRDADVAIDFSVTEAVLNHVEVCAKAGVPLIEGTTNWSDKLSDARNIIERHEGLMLYGANFSIGINLFYRVVERAAELFAGATGYDAFLTEAHHKQKRDAPSGTALVLQRIVEEKINRRVDVASLRTGFIPGTHSVGFDSIADTIELTHTARSREGFARGALQAAEWLAQQNKRTGMFEFGEVLDEILAASESKEGEL